METPINDPNVVVRSAIIVGSGFGGIGMAIALQKAGIDDFIILERAHDVGGVWRDNDYPGAACDVPSRLYSFSFEPNADWSRVFAPQAEIHGYLRQCVEKYALGRHLRFNADVQEARFDERTSTWWVTLVGGQTLRSALLITATGQLSRPRWPQLPGVEQFEGVSFHSAQWNHECVLNGKRVAVIGTGASAVQFVPVIAGAARQLTIFQRSPAHILPRTDRAYSRWEQSVFRQFPLAARLHRAALYARYEVRAVAFTRFKGLLRLAVGVPFHRLLKRQVPDATLRARLAPDYPIGCKRILLSSDYLATISRPNVQLVTHEIRRVTETGIETADGVHHAADVIIYGTGFAATDFLAPMRITGRAGRMLADAWRDGAAAFLGLTVPGFPNLFMLYGPNTNLGHNSIVYMLESQIAHVLKCLQAMRGRTAKAIEVNTLPCIRYNARVQQRLKKTVWNGCRSWYVSATGYNSVNWPGFSFSYRWLTRFSGMQSYSFAHSSPDAVGITVAEPTDWWEKMNAALLRGVLRLAFRPFVGPPFGAITQRRFVRVLSTLMPGVRGVTCQRRVMNGVSMEVVSARRNGASGGVMLYLHGGAFCLGSPATHRSVTTRLAEYVGMDVYVPDYRLAPEHPYPAALDDAMHCYDALRAEGRAANGIVIAGDSAGGSLALAVALRLRARGDIAPAGLLLISPATDFTAEGASMVTGRAHDPMIRPEWIAQALRWYNCPSDADVHRPLAVDLQGLPPMLIHVGDQEVLLDDSLRLAAHATACSVPCRLEVFAGRWHVFHLHALSLRSARTALRSLAAFAQHCVTLTSVSVP